MDSVAAELHLPVGKDAPWQVAALNHGKGSDSTFGIGRNRKVAQRVLLDLAVSLPFASSDVMLGLSAQVCNV